MSGQGFDDDDRLYRVVMNHEEQYSIWPEGRENAPGWKDVGKSGSKAECLGYIEEVWTDMRPLSLRKKMEEWEKNQATRESEESAEQQPPVMDDLLERLSEGQHVVVSIRPKPTVEELRRRIDNGYVHIRFTQTTGGTELGVRLAREKCDLTNADFTTKSGTVRLVGTLRLNYVPVECSADIELNTFEGVGHLTRINPDGADDS